MNNHKQWTDEKREREVSFCEVVRVPNDEKNATLKSYSVHQSFIQSVRDYFFSPTQIIGRAMNPCPNLFDTKFIQKAML